MFRYTYANIAKQLGYSKDLIAEALGHEYGNKVTGWKRFERVHGHSYHSSLNKKAALFRAAFHLKFR